MRNFNFYNLMLICLLSLSFFATTNAQEETTNADESRNENRRFSQRPNLLQELELTPEQIQQIKRFNENRKSSMIESQRRVREATRNLDQAIYADALNETEIATRLKELQAAQAEIAKLRSYNELEVRKILTPEQLIKFRELRRKFAERRENYDNRRNNKSDNPNRNAPNRRFNRQLRKIQTD